MQNDYIEQLKAHSSDRNVGAMPKETLWSCHSTIIDSDGKYGFLHSSTISSSNHMDSYKHTVNDCIQKCRLVLGLRTQEVAKLVGVSRASLTRDRKRGYAIGSHDGYELLHQLACDVERQYGVSLAPYVRNVLIEGKTLIRHLYQSDCTFESMSGVLKATADRCGNIDIIKSAYDADTAQARLYNLSKKA